MTSRRSVLAAAGVGLVAAVAVLLTACGSDDPGDPSREKDIEFAQSMIPHHQQAIEMADLAATNATSADVKQLAEQIRQAQDPEIATMRGWLSAWEAPEEMEMDHSEMGSMPGMMGDEAMDKLAAARGAEFDTLWLQMMVDHHEGAVTMANDVLASTDDPAVKTLAQAVVDGQTKEIDTMNGLLAAVS